MLCLLFLTIGLAAAQDWPCDKQEVLAALKTQKLAEEYPNFESDPYTAKSTNMDEVVASMNNPNIFCGLKYDDESKSTYALKTFTSKDELTDAGFTVTHRGPCAACSTMQDLHVYLSRPDLTTPVRKCGFKSFIPRWTNRCLRNLGFTPQCAQIWQDNIENTRRECGRVCIKQFFTGAGNNAEGDELNECIKCDEDKSGPVFKYYAGRTRRGSGITSAIQRKSGECIKCDEDKSGPVFKYYAGRTRLGSDITCAIQRKNGEISQCPL